MAKRSYSNRRIVRPISRRTLLRGVAGIGVALPFLEGMRTKRVEAQEAATKRFFGFFIPNGTDTIAWQPAVTEAINEAGLTKTAVDLKGFDAEGEWPGCGPLWQDITWVTGIGHDAITGDIHAPSMSLSAHKKSGSNEVPGAKTLDQRLADDIQGTAPFRVLFSSPTGDRAITQGYLSFRDGNGEAETAYRSARDLFDAVFAGVQSGGGEANPELDALRARQQSILDWAKEDAARLNQRLGQADKQRVDRYLESVFELEQQIQATTSSGGGCEVPGQPGQDRDMHAQVKMMTDLSIMAMQCDLTRVAVIQYSNSWDVHWGKYNLADGVSDWSDHFISHKVQSGDHATDLDSLPSAEAQRVADARVVNTSRIKTRRFANVISALKEAETANGSLWDESLAMYFSENGDGNSHSRIAIPILLSGGLGGFKTGRVIDAYMNNQRYPTGALHASILELFGIDSGGNYGNPGAPPLPGLV